MSKKSRSLVLASSSPRRRELLSAHGYHFEIVTPDVSEIAPEHLTAAEITLWNAKAKALAVAPRRPECVLLGADTLVALDGAPIGKPRDLDDAFAMLARLSGRTHEVFSGVWLARAASGESRGFIEVSQVRLRQLSASEIHDYFSQIDPLDKAGAYAAQDDPLGIIEEIRGSRTNVIGLPMESLARALHAFGVGV